MSVKEDRTVSEVDRWVMGALTVIAVSLIIAAGFSDEPRLFLGYLAGPAGLAIAYFALIRD